MSRNVTLELCKLLKHEDGLSQEKTPGILQWSIYRTHYDNLFDWFIMLHIQNN